MRRRNLDQLRELWRALAAGELEAVRQRLSPDVRIVAHGNEAGLMNARGIDDARRYFAMIFESGVSRLEYEVDQLVVDASGICTAGRVRIPYPGSILRVLGHDVDDPEALYLYEARILMIWSLDEAGRVREQASYAAGDGFENIAERKLGPQPFVHPRSG